MLENLFLVCVYVCAFMVFFTICAGINWLLEKIGFNRWLRGWLWYFGLIDKYPDTKRDR